MGRKLRTLLGALKDKASLSKASSLSCSSSLTAADVISAADSVMSTKISVFRATTHHPPFDPPSQKNMNAILSISSAPRPFAAAAVKSLCSRLSSTADASVALKCLLVLHCIYSSGAFIFQDQIFTVFLPNSTAGKRNPLNLSSFRDSRSTKTWQLSSWVRWYARVLELLLSTSNLLLSNSSVSTVVASSTKDAPVMNLAGKEEEEQKVTALLMHELLKETELLVGLLEEINILPENKTGGSPILYEVVKMVEKERLVAERRLLVRVKEMSERVESTRYADWVELLCLFSRLDRCRKREEDEQQQENEGEYYTSEFMRRNSEFRKMYWSEIDEAKKRAEVAVVKMEVERRRSVIRRERLGESARVVPSRLVGAKEPFRFGSSRWLNR